MKFDFIGIGTLTAEIERLISPITAQRFINNIPIKAQGRYFIGGKDFFMIPIGIKKNIESPTDILEKGEIAYEASSDSLMICLNSGKTMMNISKMGKVTSGLDIFEKIGRNNGVKITQIK
ncbi:MAG: hypothetical protein GY870_10775 [archaeon]|nr:hypothetical protein [archaeon]